MRAKEFFNLIIMGSPIKIIKSFNLADCKRIALSILFLFIINYSFCKPNTTAIKGVLDLQHRNWAKDGLANLNGEWEFFWNALYIPSSFDSAVIQPSAYAIVPGFWNNLI